MIHFQPEQPATGAPYGEAVDRLRSVRKALALVEMFEGRPRRNLDDITFEALIGAEGTGEKTHPAALAVLGETLRRDLAGIEALFAGRA